MKENWKRQTNLS